MIHTIDASKCTGCGTCFKTCGLDVFRLDTDQPTLSPCAAACPAGTDMRACNYLLQQGKREEAAQKIMEKNPFPAITGRVCPHTCEKECSRTRVDGAVNINALEQYLGDFSLNDMPEKPAVRHIHKTAVAGSGPAGLSCAWFLAKAGYPVTVFEALPEPGGMLRWGIPAYRLPTAVVEAQIARLRALGVKFVCNTTIGDNGDISFEELKNRGFKAVCLAVGASVSRRAGIAGEDLPGVFHGLEFLRAARRNSSDKPEAMPDFPQGGRVVVVGGGDVAVDAAITALKLGAAEVTMVCLEEKDAMPAFPHNVEDAEREGVNILAGWGPVEIHEKSGRAAGLRIRRCLGVWDEEHRFSPRFDDADTRELDAEAVVFAIGQAGDLSFFPTLEKASPTRLAVDPVTMNTSIWNVFAAGDAVTGPASVIKAVRAGREASLSMTRLLMGAHLHSEREETRPVAEHLPGENIRSVPRLERSLCAAEGFGETRRGFDDIDALNESMRCMTCGARARISFRDDCMTCFFCELNCPAGAITVHPFKERLPLTLESNIGGF